MDYTNTTGELYENQLIGTPEHSNTKNLNVTLKNSHSTINCDNILQFDQNQNIEIMKKEPQHIEDEETKLLDLDHKSNDDKLQQRQKLINECSYILSIQDDDDDDGSTLSNKGNETRETSKCTCSDCQNGAMRLRGGKANSKCICTQCLSERCTRKNLTKNEITNRTPTCNCRPCICNPCRDLARNSKPRCDCPENCRCKPCGDPTVNIPAPTLVGGNISPNRAKCDCPESCICNPCGDSTRNRKTCDCPDTCLCNPCERPSPNKRPSAPTPVNVKYPGDISPSRLKCDCPDNCICNPCGDSTRNRPKCDCPENCLCNPCGDPSRNIPKCDCPDHCACSPCGDPSKSAPVLLGGDRSKCDCPDNCICNPCGDATRNRPKCVCLENALYNPCGDPSRNKPANVCICSGDCRCKRCSVLMIDTSAQTTAIVCSCSGECKCKPCEDQKKGPPFTLAPCKCPENACVCAPCLDSNRQKKEPATCTCSLVCDCGRCSYIQISPPASASVHEPSIPPHTQTPPASVHEPPMPPHTQILPITIREPSLPPYTQIPTIVCEPSVPAYTQIPPTIREPLLPPYTHTPPPTVCEPSTPPTGGCEPSKPTPEQNENQCVCEKCECKTCHSLMASKTPTQPQDQKIVGCPKVNNVACDCTICSCNFGPPQPQKYNFCVCAVDLAQTDQSKPLGCACPKCICDPCSPVKPSFVEECKCEDCSCSHCKMNVFEQPTSLEPDSKYPDSKCGNFCTTTCLCCKHCNLSMEDRTCQHGVSDSNAEYGRQEEHCTCRTCDCEQCVPKRKKMDACNCPMDKCSCNTCKGVIKKLMKPNDCVCRECTCDPCEPKFKDLDNCTCDMCAGTALTIVIDNDVATIDVGTSPENEEEYETKTDPPNGAQDSCKCSNCQCQVIEDDKRDGVCCICNDSMSNTVGYTCEDHCNCKRIPVPTTENCNEDIKICQCEPTKNVIDNSSPNKTDDMMNCLCGTICNCTECLTSKNPVENIKKDASTCGDGQRLPTSFNSCECSKCECTLCVHNSNNNNNNNPPINDSSMPQTESQTVQLNCRCNRTDSCECLKCWCENCSFKVVKLCDCISNKCEIREEKIQIPEFNCFTITKDKIKDLPCACCPCNLKKTEVNSN